MGRRKDHTREELYELAVTAATELVRESGPSKLTARSLADRIGYTAGTLYNVFENLDELVAHVNSRTLKQLEQAFLAHAKGATPEERLMKIARTYMDFYKKEPFLWELLFTMPIQNKPDWYRKSIVAAFEALAAGFIELGLKPADARQQAKIMWSTLHGLCSLDHAGKLDIGVQDSIDSLAKRFLQGYLEHCISNSSK